MASANSEKSGKKKKENQIRQVENVNRRKIQLS